MGAESLQLLAEIVNNMTLLYDFMLEPLFIVGFSDLQVVEAFLEATDLVLQ